jgi:16S rRNA (guanine966-N2)-methyltransferase
VAQTLTLLVVHGWVQPGGSVVVERSARSVTPTWPDGLEPQRRKKYGETVLWYLLRDLDADQDMVGRGGPSAVM